MLLMGDEVRRTQGGNNNAYCHDDPTSWFDWTAVERHADILRFTKGLIRIRRRVATRARRARRAGLLDMLARRLARVERGASSASPTWVTTRTASR